MIVCFRCGGRMRELVRPEGFQGAPVGHNVRCTQCYYERPADPTAALLHLSVLQAQAEKEGT